MNLTQRLSPVLALLLMAIVPGVAFVACNGADENDPSETQEDIGSTAQAAATKYTTGACTCVKLAPAPSICAGDYWNCHDACVPRGPVCVTTGGLPPVTTVPPPSPPR